MLRPSPFLRAARTLSTFLRPHLAGLAGAALTMLLVTGIHLARPLILRELIDTALPARDAGLALRLGLAFVGALALGAGALYTRAVLLAGVATSVMARLKGAVFGHLLAQDLRFFDGHPPGKLISRVENDIEQMRGLVSGAAAQLAANALLLAGITVLTWWQAPVLGRWLLLVVIGGGVAVAVYARFIRQLWHEVRERDSEMAARVTEFVQGVSLLRLFGREEAAVERVAAATRSRTDLEARGVFYDAVLFYGGFTFLAEIGGLAAVLWYGTGEVFAGRLTVGTLVMFLELLRRFFGPLRDLAEVFVALQSGLAATGRVFGLFDLRPEGAGTGLVAGDQGTTGGQPVPPGAAAAASSVLPLRVAATAGGGQTGAAVAGGSGLVPVPSRFREIAFREVRFAYGAEPVLHDLSFAVRCGQRIGIVGASGSGKSTCINLLLRFYDPTAGAIEIDGCDLRAFDPRAWRRKVALVLQEIHLFPGTVMENLKAFAPGIHDGRVLAAARELGADRFIRRLPAGYATVLAERGANLSLGERQLLCYVRALVRNPDLLILDEATSAVDAVTERRLQQAMERLMAGRTAVIIAHRLTTVVAADRILVLERGRLAEAGTHAELVGRPGPYRTLAAMQGLDLGARAGRRGRRERRADRAAARPAQRPGPALSAPAAA
ncbi:MAG: ABC transporter ATP-binding protein [Candidatus Riflebacteria bacterium]|nr:ABC transporter ATP-binding protein [Candidatus Riflebacteria bacterium]